VSSKTRICNLSLMLLGHSANIVNVDTDNTQRAADLLAVYDEVRNAALADHPWKFALVRKTLPAKDTAPEWGFANAYEFPTDPVCLDVYRLDPENHGDEPEWDRVGNEIHTDEGAPLYVEFIGLVTNEALFHPMFVTYFAARLAEWTGLKITGKAGIAEEMAAKANGLARDARWKSAVATGRKRQKDGDFLNARRGAG
jgi:hypothetical protein